MDDRSPCPCCGHLTLPAGGPTYGLCPVCFWEDDPVQLRFPLSADGANGISLMEAQATYGTTGSTADAFRTQVRAARSDEPLDPGWRPWDLSRDWFESHPPPDHDARWPRHPGALYWWRPTYWNGYVEDHPVTYDDSPADQLVAQLRTRVPEVIPLVDRVERRFGSAAPFMVCSALSSFVLESSFREGAGDVVSRVLATLETALAGDDAFASTCVSVAFLEPLAVLALDAEVVASMPLRLRAEYEHQHTHLLRASSLTVRRPPRWRRRPWRRFELVAEWRGEWRPAEALRARWSRRRDEDQTPEQAISRQRESLHLHDALVRVATDPARVLETVTAAEDTESARAALQEMFGWTPIQAAAVLDQQLRRLPRFERQRTEQQRLELTAHITALEARLDGIAAPVPLDPDGNRQR